MHSAGLAQHSRIAETIRTAEGPWGGPMRWRDLEKPEAFSAYMESVDARLRDQGVDIPARPIRAFMLISEELKTRFTWDSGFARRINSWFKERYAERLNINTSTRRMLALVRDDAYAIVYPLVFGTVRLSLLQVIPSVTPTTLHALPPGELQALLDLVRHGYGEFEALSRVPRQLLADRDTAVDQALARPPALGLSRWSSQQSVEKMLNWYLENKSGGTWKFTRKKGAKLHDLGPVVAEAQGFGLAALDAEHLKSIECTAQVRYPGRKEAQAVTLADAVRANQAALFLCASIARCL